MFIKKFLIFLFSILLIFIYQIEVKADIEAFVRDSVIYWDTTTRKATSGIKYNTIGWTVHLEREADGIPRKSGKKWAELIPIENYRSDDLGNGYLQNFFWVERMVVDFGLADHGLEDIKDGDTIWLSAIMRSVQDDGNGNLTTRKGPFYTREGGPGVTEVGIKNAEAWAQPDDLNQYFNVRASFNSASDYPVDIIIRKTDGYIMNNYNKGKYKAGEQVTHSFEKIIEVNQKKFKLVRSFLTPYRSQINSDQRYIMYAPDPKAYNRTAGVYIPGLKIVGDYEECSQNDPACGTPTPIPDPTPPGTCGPSDTGPSRSSTLSGQDMSPNATGEIRADHRDSKMFDVAYGIPTSETLYANAFTKNYLFKNQWVKMSGETTYNITVKKSYVLTWTEESQGPPAAPGGPPTIIRTPKSETVDREETITVRRPYSYWLIDNLEVYKINRATMDNYALPNGTVTLHPNGYTPPSVNATNDDNHSSHIQPAPCQNVDLGSQTVSGGTSRPPVPSEDFRPHAENAVGKNKVRNDYVVFNNATIMNNNWTDEAAPTPGSIPYPAIIGRDTLYRSGLMIEAYKVNRANTPSSGIIYYDVQTGIKGGSPVNYPINGINTVTVHTPVVNYASVSDDRPHNQKTVPTANRSALILERPFIVRVPTSGQHTNYLGYGNRDYVKYVRQKQVWFPFDVYTGDQSQFIPARTWIDLNVTQLDTTFYLPVWVDEGNYEVLFRTIAENAPEGFSTQPNANLDLTHHVATQTVPVEVIGRLYDFRITDIADYNWEEVFRTVKGKADHTGRYYWTGLNGIDGEPRGIVQKFTLPIRLGSHTHSGYKNVAVKTGYHFKFDFKTKGNMFGRNDQVRITPTFYFVKSDGTGRQEVDLYYHSNEKNFIKIGSADDQLTRTVVLNERLRNVPEQQLQDTARYYFTRYYSGTNTFNQYLEQYMKEVSRPMNVGKQSLMLLHEGVRTFVGPRNVPSGVDPLRANASIQQWYGEYSIPATVYAVPKGFNLYEWGRKNGGLTDKSPIFLKKGYIIVNFNIETISQHAGSNPHLQYINAPYNNQWRSKEGFPTTVTDAYGNRFQLRDGDIIFYHADQSSHDDFEARVNH